MLHKAATFEARTGGYWNYRVPGGAILCIYECGMIDGMTDTPSVVVARFDLSWLTAHQGGAL
jgi:hypothetical protein